ncbi:MAG: hypothetical protein K8F52_01295 [Candidatus Scalindua rubra]|uniref:Tetratricopeptide repeat protein n=1 Tax=Candidatus Scalindua brodae TaxID=237368 RepID=A0A0B0EHW6_9BACT|nr:MAG: hypothetical protein SCABRO_02059 [Candidatus Scalindua brodae]MBZ0107277.1 hypothetical protein [Candidatus Scalindua rubra]TWU32098.1 hypothetical protein S225a_18620 [Candidatus Brocadiaceae bacterium S225]
MRYISFLLMFIPILFISGFTWAGSCERCYEKITDDKQFCTECELSTSNKLNERTDKPARFKAAWVYDNQLKNYAEAARHYNMALETCKETQYLEIAETRLGQLKKEGY